MRPATKSINLLFMGTMLPVLALSLFPLLGAPVKSLVLDPPGTESETTEADEEADFSPMFDSQTLTGWRKVGGGASYSVEDDCIIGVVGPGANTFLRTEKEYGDFDLRLELKFDEPGNSGIQFRSHQKNGDGTVFGYQCEVDSSSRAWSGGIYDESRRGWIFDLKGEDRAEARAAFNVTEWNAFRIKAVGDHIQTWVNGVPCADFHDDADATGFIALQVHTGSRGRIRWRNIRIQEFVEAHDDDIGGEAANEPRP